MSERMILPHPFCEKECFSLIFHLDGREVCSRTALHALLKRGLNLPDYYGENLDALWDCLTDMVGNEKLHIEIIGLDVLRKKLDVLEYRADKLLETFYDFKHCYDDEYADQILIEIVDGDKRTVIE